MDDYIFELNKGLTPDKEWVEVTKEEWIRAERAAGFRPRMSSDDPRYMSTCATSGFDGRNGMAGRLRFKPDA